MNKSQTMNSFLESLIPGRAAKMAAGDCVGCSNKNCLIGMSELEVREYRISGLCKVCQDSVFNYAGDSKKRKVN